METLTQSGVNPMLEKHGHGKTIFEDMNEALNKQSLIMHGDDCICDSDRDSELYQE